MSKIALLDQGNFVRRVVELGELTRETYPYAGTKVAITGAEPAIGMLYIDGVFQAYVPPVDRRTLLTLREWISTFTIMEWALLKDIAAGNRSPSPVASDDAEQLDRWLDIIRAGSTYDVASSDAQAFYAYLVAQGWITSVRGDELKLGLLV